jgi:ribonuclease BN (tRNA processing enzyme)
MMRSIRHAAAMARIGLSTTNVASISHMNRYRNRFCSLPVKRLNNPSKWHISGTSVAGVATSLFLIEPQIMVDAGALLTNEHDDTNIIPSDLLITHHHGDHNRNIGFYAEQTNDRRRGNTVNIVDPVTDHHHALGGRRYSLNNGIFAETFELDHTIKSVGYGITSADGTKEVAIMGDTRIDPLYEMPEILDFPVIVIECTNYDANSNRIGMYRRYGHLSWKEIKDVIVNNKDNYFHLIHPSAKLDVRRKRWIQENLIERAGIHNAEIWTG